MNFAPDFISCVESGNENGIPDFYPENSTLAQVARHVTYIGDLIGYDHVGLGSDFDGIASTPAGLEDVSKFPDLVAELLAHGVSDEDASKIVGGNSKALPPLYRPLPLHPTCEEAASVRMGVY